MARVVCVRPFCRRVYVVVILALLVRVLLLPGHPEGRGRFCTSLCCFNSQSCYPTAVSHFHLSVGAKEASDITKFDGSRGLCFTSHNLAASQLVSLLTLHG